MQDKDVAVLGLLSRGLQRELVQAKVQPTLHTYAVFERMAATDQHLEARA